ncbi:MAG TPA: hypothetical protein VMS08_02695 [Candidatus Saccharimonadia bacterium]|nr:hypothetical protein [Candidatus Saccharimonadia bacterium]
MSKPFGISAQLTGYMGPDVVETLPEGAFEVEIKNSAMTVGFDSEADRAKAVEIGEAYVRAHTFRTDQKITADFDQTWRANKAGGTGYSISVSDAIKPTGRLQIEVTSANGKDGAEPERYDEASFANDAELARKSLKDPILADSLKFFAEEVVDGDRPLYGAYKSVEVIKKHVGGWDKLADLAGQSHAYVNALTNAAQDTRHAGAPRHKLTEAECKIRAKVLIQAYAYTMSL